MYLLPLLRVLVLHPNPIATRSLNHPSSPSNFSCAQVGLKNTINLQGVFETKMVAQTDSLSLLRLTWRWLLYLGEVRVSHLWTVNEIGGSVVLRSGRLWRRSSKASGE